MAIINRTPDSFYDKGATFHLEKALERADAVIADGASIVDVGGVKAGPGEQVSVAEEIGRVVPLIAAGFGRASARALRARPGARGPRTQEL